MQHPVEGIQWRHHSELKANDYNPNMVLNAELNLLEHNLIQYGWIQPILTTPSGYIIDGFHRWRLAQESKALLARDEGMVPCCVMPIDEGAARILTIRMNRAKGTHVAIRMSAIVHDLIDVYGLTADFIAAELGATRAEIDLLYQENVFTAKKISQYRYSKAWVPVEVKSERKPSVQ